MFSRPCLFLLATAALQLAMATADGQPVEKLFLPAEAAAAEQSVPPGLDDDTDIEQSQVLNNQRIQIRRLQQNISEQKSLARETIIQEQDILAEVETLDIRLKEQQEKIHSFSIQITRQQSLLSNLHSELAILEQERKRVEQHLLRRIKAFYTMGKIGLLNVTFSSKDLPELLKFRDAFTTLIRYDEQLIKRYQAQYAELDSKRQKHALEQSVLEDFIKQATAEKEISSKLKDQKEQLLEHVRTQHHLHTRAIREMEAAAGKLTATLQTAKVSESRTAFDFASQKGKLPPPLSGPVITRFQQESANKLGIVKKSMGIAIGVNGEEKVRSIAPGTVIFAGYLRGFGNTVILDHGHQYFSITSRLEQIECAKGNVLPAGGLLGYSGTTAMLIDDGIYLEIRRDKESIDPLPWLDMALISFAPGTAAQ